MNEGRIPAAKKYITRYTFAIDRARRTIHLLLVRVGQKWKEPILE
jgi:hypothetical protein